jgi:AcrR family transcriptional regulator
LTKRPSLLHGEQKQNQFTTGGVSVKRKLSSEDRKAQVLSVARTLFSRKGYAETTLDDIARKVGISRPRIIQLFGSKRGVYEMIAETAYTSHPMDKDLANPIQQKDDLAVFETFAFHVLYHTQKKEERENLKILMNARLREDHFHRLHFHKKDTLMISRLEDYVRSRSREGAFVGINPQTVIYAYQAMVSNLAIYKNVMKKMDFVSIEELSRDCARIFLKGLARNPETGT